MRRGRFFLLALLAFAGARCLPEEDGRTSAVTSDESRCAHHRCRPDASVAADAAVRPDSGVSPDSGTTTAPDSGTTTAPDSGTTTAPDSGTTTAPDSGLFADAGAADSSVPAIGVPVNGFPNWSERVLHEWTNRARVEPSVEMAACGSACGEASCYSPLPPLRYGRALNASARFNSRFMSNNNYFAHNTPCTLVSTLGTIYPSPCNGQASCSCAGGAVSTTESTSPWTRIGLFGGTGSGEIIAETFDGNPNTAFYLWLFESSSSATCAFSASNGHRWLILASTAADVGFGNDPAAFFTGDFGNGGATTSWKIPSGSHYPRSGASVALWANWYDSSAPAFAQVDIGGSCTDLTLARGTATNGAWTANATGLSGCARYFFRFKDAAGTIVTYPTAGSLGIGDASCADWDSARPVEGAGCLN